MKRFIGLILIICIFSIMVCGCKEKMGLSDKKDNIEEQYEEAANTPFGKYPEMVTYTLGKEITTNRSNMPAGDTYENNAYTRYLLEILNI